MKIKLFITVFLLLMTGIPLTDAVTVEQNKNENLLVENNSVTNNNIDWWPMFQHDLSHSGFSNSNQPVTNDVLWKFRSEKYLFFDSAPVVVDNMLYIGINFFGPEYNEILCFDVDSGDIIWRMNPNDQIHGSPAVYNDRLYIALYNTFVICLNRFSGETIWKIRLGEYILSSFNIVVDENKVFVSCSNSNNEENDKSIIYCLNADSGDVIWDYKTYNLELFYSENPSITIQDDKLFAIGEDNHLICLNKDTGSLLWENNEFVAVTSPTYFNGYLFAGSESNQLYCVDTKNGYVNWIYTYDEGYYMMAPICAAYGDIYFAIDHNNYLNSGKIICLNADNGNKNWEYTHDDDYQMVNCIIAADKAIYTYSAQVGLAMSGFVFCLDCTNGDLIYMKKTCDFNKQSHFLGFLIIAEEKLFLASNEYEWGNQHENWATLTCFGSLNNDPSITQITGETSGKPGEKKQYTLLATDPGNDDLYYYIDWDDGTNSGWIGPYSSGEQVKINHTWQSKGSYQIKAHVKNQNNFQGSWGNLKVSMSNAKIKPRILNLFQKFIERYQNGILNRLAQKYLN